jgi:hypothetical protein
MVDFGNALHGGNRVAFEQELQDQFGLLDRQVHAIKRLLAWLQERLGTLLALEPLATFAVFTVLLAFGTAVVTRHCDSP